MKLETEAVSSDEFVLRCIWGQYFDPALPLPIRERAFSPRSDEGDGISVFRLACVAAAEDVLSVFAESKRDSYGITMLSVGDLAALGLSVVSSPITGVAGHAVIPELNSDRCKADKLWCNGMRKRLSVLATARMIRVPMA